ncbi:MAG: polysaccharide deacetylase family protein [Caldilineaceae bacterium]|nr:polysaccharide deacetylase family protein [Caldilineaceae bacterium]
MPETLFVLTNDDAGSQEPHLFAELLDFLQAEEVPATFFVVPLHSGQPLDCKPQWMPLIERALAAGHDLEHHAYTHSSCFEFGVPPYFMLDIMPEARDKYIEEPTYFTQHHGYETLREKLEQGREILTRAFGYTPRGFRSPCLSSCDNLYQALADMDFVFCSNEVINPLGWRYINRAYETGEGWHTDLPHEPYSRLPGLVEAPMHSEYTWYLEAGDVDRHFALAKADLDRAIAEGKPFVTLSHYYAMTGQWATGLQVYARLFAYARERGVRFTTLRELVAAQNQV